jgi:hypothetical protein
MTGRADLQVFEKQEIHQNKNMKCGHIHDSVLEVCGLASRNNLGHLKMKCVEVVKSTASNNTEGVKLDRTPTVTLLDIAPATVKRRTGYTYIQQMMMCAIARENLMIYSLLQKS